jgi:hypothetical protein
VALNWQGRAAAQTKVKEYVVNRLIAAHGANHWCVPRRWAAAFAIWLVAGLIVPAETGRVYAAPTEPQQLPEWVEPRGLSIPDLVGQVPEEHLSGAIVSDTAGGGILRYLSGERRGSQVIVRVRVYPRWGSDGTTYFNCLGQRAHADSWPIAVPASTMRIFKENEELTSRVIWVSYFPSNLTYPIADATKTRYPEANMPPDFAANGALQVPANTGCKYVLEGRYDDFIAEF